MKPLIKALALLLAAIPLAGCASIGDSANNDPFEPVNRKIFALDMRLERHVVSPVESPYNRLVPLPIRHSIRDFLRNLDAPVTFANDVFQGEIDRAAQTLGRLAVNSTLGVGGLADVATRIGIPYHNEDFGQTLAVWGVNEGPYLVLPLVGPDTARDLAGQTVDYFLNPLNDISYKQKLWWTIGRVSVAFVDRQSRTTPDLEGIERHSVDLYAAIRSIYRQNRQNEIHNGRIEDLGLPDY